MTDEQIGVLYTYTIKDGNYELKTLNDTNNKAGYKNHADKATFKTDKDTIGGYAIADDAVIFVKDKAETKIMTGKTVKDWNADFGTRGEVLVSEINGIKYVKVAALVGSNDKPTASGDYLYAYLTEDAYIGQTKDADKDDALVFTVFGENGAATLYDTDDVNKKGYDVANFKKGQLIEYKEDGDKIIEVKVVSGADAIKTAQIKTVAITGVEDKNKGLVYFLDSTTDAAVSPNTGKSTSLKLDEDAYFVKIDDAENTAEAGSRSEVTVAHSETNGKKTANAYIAVVNGKIVAVYYDVDKLDDGIQFTDAE